MCVLCFFQVARLSAKDSGYLLRDDLYRLVQKDWPGYSEEERQLLARLLARSAHTWKPTSLSVVVSKGWDRPLVRFGRLPASLKWSGVQTSVSTVYL